MDETCSRHRLNGMRVAAEWEPQRAVWIAWPHHRDTWPGRFASIPGVFAEFVSCIAEVVPTRVIGTSRLRQLARHRLPTANVTWCDIETNDSWIRDFGPTFVLEQQRRRYAIDWRFNAWGGKYPPWDADDAAAAAMIRHAGWRRVAGGLCLEGGAMEWDGQGRLLTTPRCLVTPTRNPGLDRTEVETRLAELTGAREIVWVDGGGLEGDDTDGHIDQLARFLDPENVVVATASDPADSNHPALAANERALRRWAASTQPAVRVHRLPIPPARFIQGQRLPESYCNFVRLGPDRLLVPTFGAERADQLALDTLKQLAQHRWPQVEVIGIDCRELIWGLGALHCASCNEPHTEAMGRGGRDAADDATQRVT
jgi:agmatine deiminase